MFFSSLAVTLRPTAGKAPITPGPPPSRAGPPGPGASAFGFLPPLTSQGRRAPHTPPRRAHTPFLRSSLSTPVRRESARETHAPRAPVPAGSLLGLGQDGLLEVVGGQLLDRAVAVQRQPAVLGDVLLEGQHGV